MFSLIAELREQILRMNRLSQDFELMSFGSRLFQQIGCSRLSGEEKNLAGRQELADVDRGVDSVHVVHDDVADNQIWTLAARFLDGAGAAIDSGCGKSVLIEDDCQCVGDYALVIDYQYFGFSFSAVVLCHPSLSVDSQRLALSGESGEGSA